MNYLTYSICESQEQANINMRVIESNMRKVNFITEEESWFIPQQVGIGIDKPISKYYFKNPDSSYMKGTILTNVSQTDSHPAYLDIPTYTIYNYLNDAAKVKFKDYSIVPHAVDYVVDITPRLHPNRTFYTGLLTDVTWSSYDFDTKTPIEEVLKVHNDFYMIDDADFPSAKTVEYRITTRQWYRKEVGYDETLSDVKITRKDYDTPILQRSEGMRRRNNIYIDMTNNVVTLLAIMFYSNDPVPKTSALTTGFGFLGQYAAYISPYKNDANPLFITSIENDTNPTYLTILDTTIPNVFPINALFPDAVGLTIRNYMIEKLKGNI